MKSPREVVLEWVAAYIQQDARAAARLYREEAINLQVALGDPMVGGLAIRESLTTFFHAFPDNFTRIENLFEDGEWAILEWFGGGTWRGEFAGMAPNGKSFTLRGCGFFRVTEGKISFQRGYFDRASWFGQLGISVTTGEGTPASDAPQPDTAWCIRTLGSTFNPTSCSRSTSTDSSAPGTTYLPLSGKLIPVHSSHRATGPGISIERGASRTTPAPSLRSTRSQRS